VLASLFDASRVRFVVRARITVLFVVFFFLRRKMGSSRGVSPEIVAANGGGPADPAKAGTPAPGRSIGDEGTPAERAALLREIMSMSQTFIVRSSPSPPST